MVPFLRHLFDQFQMSLVPHQDDLPNCDKPACDTAGMDSSEPRWSSDVRQADWIAPRLAPWEGDYTAALVVPAGFEAYARVLHPAQTAQHGDRLVSWAEVAAWSGMPLRQDAQFHSIALPPAAPGEPPPYHSQGPRDGSLSVPDAEVLAAILRDWTATPEDCWFCVWDGYGWASASSFFAVTASAGTGQPPQTVAPPKRDPVSGPVRGGPPGSTSSSRACWRMTGRRSARPGDRSAPGCDDRTGSATGS
jgi:hypothetical protein